MDSNWATEQLQTIRTLMERSALYRRALAPIMIWTGLVGIAGGIMGWTFQINSDRGFILFWSCTAVVALLGALLLVRRQSLKDSEPFWSPPTRRVAQALLPPLCIGCFLNCVMAYSGSEAHIAIFLIILWMWLYGCAVHAAGFFMMRGIKLFGCIFIILGCILFLKMKFAPDWLQTVSIHFLTAGVFGGLHLAYGAYLYLTERGKNAA